MTLETFVKDSFLRYFKRSFIQIDEDNILKINNIEIYGLFKHISKRLNTSLKNNNCF
jgi:hypothetical protein